MEWTEFLAEIADAHCLSPEQTEAFLIRLDDGNRGESEAKLASELNISAYAFKKRMSGVYEQFAQSCPELTASGNRGKLQKLRAYLRKEYAERSHKPLTHPDVSNVGTIQPIPEGINWHEVCGKVLAQQREKQNFKRSITGRHLGHEAKNVYVKLGLVKPKGQPRRSDESQPSADRGMLQYQLTEQEIEQEYQYDEFLEQVIEGQEKNLTIVGEPGAGKSTWLEQIALYVENSNKGFPICISLASLGGKTLEEYLFQTWLKNALLISHSDVGITSAQKKLEELFKSGKVWLLLDGVDEMRADESPLQAIATQLEGWGDLARVVLTCRSNVWEANSNALLNFETYRTLHFNDEQVGDFIQQWFTQEGEPKLGEDLETKLDEARNNRIRDLIKNPLRLAMLCGIWYFHQGDLPKTKATLYQQYIEYFYRWKPHPQLTDDLDKQEELHAAFSKLALEAIDKKLPLRQKFAHKVMGKSLFQLARDVGWLNWVYKDAETGQDVYAFFHLTFQEYFAALEVKDWHYFLNHVPDNPEQGTYRIFEPKWKEVILLWLGREGNKDVRNQKEEFIEALVKFEDGWDGFYRYHAYFLASAGVAELEDYSRANEILIRLFEWGFASFHVKKNAFDIEDKKFQISFNWHKPGSNLISELARKALRETEYNRAVTLLTKGLEIYQNIWKIEPDLLNAYNQGQIDISFKNEVDDYARELRVLIAYTLGKISPKNSDAIYALTEEINTLIEDLGINEEKNLKTIEIHKIVKAMFCVRTACMLFEINPGNPKAIKVLKTIISRILEIKIDLCMDEIVPLLSQFNFSLINPKYSQDIWDLIPSSSSNQKIGQQEYINVEELAANLNLQNIMLNAPEQFIVRGVTSQTPISEILRLDLDKQTLCTIVALLRSTGKERCSGEADIADVLVHLLCNNQDLDIRLQVTYSLKAILTKKLFSVVIKAMKNCWKNSLHRNDIELYKHCYGIIWHCAQNMPYPDFYQAWNQTAIQ